ncbi:MAG TPA: GNAT family N-acetyltransferase [Candidatus Binataceae bacterium]|nr:GNAT family N-acetyltransferase [Candidatus Binataceae bacterium]
MALKPPRTMEAGDLQRARSFDCGVVALNEWLRRFAWQNHNSGGARVYLSIDDDQDRVAGYYCLSAAAIEYVATPDRISKGLAHHPIPCVLIGRLAADQRYSGLGLGHFLVRDAFQRILETADRVGVRAIVVQAKDEAAAEFYRHLGFIESVQDARLFLMTLKDARKSLAAAK